MLQADVEEGGAGRGPLDQQESLTDLAVKLEKLEENVCVHRMLLEAEEQLLYVDVITELERTQGQLDKVRRQQQQRYTPWVCFLGPAFACLSRKQSNHHDVVGPGQYKLRRLDCFSLHSRK